MNNYLGVKEFKELTKYNKPFGLYLHIPLCSGKCRYCDFYSIDYTEKLMEQFLNCLHKEIELYSKLLPEKKLLTIYLGGGTPGLLKVKDLELLLEKIYKLFSYPETGEITMEANPCSLDEEKLKGFSKAGVTRLSLGVQSFQNKDLKFLGRKHNSLEALRIIELAGNLFNNLNLDLIFAIPGQTLKEWHDTLYKALSFAPEHLSLYNLQIEEGTELGRLYNLGIIKEVCEELDAKMYISARNLLKSRGYEQYEISNFSQDGYRSKHNQLYWRLHPYLGLGPSAHSFNDCWRFNNFSNLKIYLEKLNVEELPIENTILLTGEEKMSEYLFMGLRLMEGIYLPEFKEIFGRTLNRVYGNKIIRLQDSGLLELDESRIKLTEKGLLLANQVFLEFLSV